MLNKRRHESESITNRGKHGKCAAINCLEGARDTHGETICPSVRQPLW